MLILPLLLSLAVHLILATGKKTAKGHTVTRKTVVKLVKQAKKHDYLDINPPRLVLLKFPSYNVPISVCLKAKPTEPVSVFMEAHSYLFSRCKLTFTPQNWNKKQVVRVSPIPFMGRAKHPRRILARFAIAAKGDKKMHKYTENFFIKRSGNNGATCYVWGDPHYETFARRSYGFQGSGTYYLVKSDRLTIQQLNLRDGAVSRQQKIAIRYHDSVYIFHGLQNTVTKDGEPNDGVRIVRLGKDTWRVTLCDGTLIRISRKKMAKGGCVMRIRIFIGEIYRGKVSGLCGLFEEKRNNKYCDPKGEALKTPKAFGVAWKVPGPDNLFAHGGNAASAKSKLALVGRRKNPGVEYCRIPDLGAAKEYGTGVQHLAKDEEVIVKFTRIDTKVETEEIKHIVKVVEVPARAPTEKWITIVKERCGKLLTIPGTEGVLDPKVYIADCVDDASLSGTFDYIDAAKDAFLSALKFITVSISIEPSFHGAETENAKKLQVILDKAVAATECPNKCSGKGMCVSASGCVCDPGYTGLDCSEEVPKPLDVKEIFTDKPAPPDIETEEVTEIKVNVVLEQIAEEDDKEMSKEEKEAGIEDKEEPPKDDDGKDDDDDDAKGGDDAKKDDAKKDDEKKDDAKGGDAKKDDEKKDDAKKDEAKGGDDAKKDDAKKDDTKKDDAKKDDH